VRGRDRNLAVYPFAQATTRNPTQKITKAKKGWGMAQVVECLPSKRKSLGSILFKSKNSQQ
jgi:hypothetical protein